MTEARDWAGKEHAGEGVMARTIGSWSGRGWDLLILALTLWGEAEGEPRRGKEAVGHVIRNRVLAGKFGESFSLVCLRRLQFSCWNPGARREQLDKVDFNNIQFMVCVAVAADILTGEGIDQTGGALFYHTAAVNPSWDDKMECTGQIGRHFFFKPKT